MTPAFYLLLSFFIAGGGVKTGQFIYPTWPCVENVVSQGARRGLFRVQVFTHEPKKGEVGPWIDPPLADYWLQ